MLALLLTPSLHISFLSSRVVGGDTQLRLHTDRDCLFFRDGEADLHSCLIICRAGKIIHVTSSRGEPRFSSPSRCISRELGAAVPRHLPGKAEGLRGAEGMGRGRQAMNGEPPEFNYPQLPPRAGNHGDIRIQGITSPQVTAYIYLFK